jgi:hypothetical protein
LKADEAFINMFGNLTVLHVVEFFFAMYFIIRISIDVIKFINKKHDEEQQKSADLAEALAGVRQMPQYRADSVKIRNQLEQKIANVHDEMNNKFDDVSNKFDAVMDRLNAMDAESKKRARNRIREELMQGYRMFTDPTKNPMKAWTSLEHDSWFAQYDDYLECNGNGDMRHRICPEMNNLDVIHMDDTEKLYELMHSRKL